MKIKYKLLLLLIVCVVLPLSVSVFLSYNSINNRLKNEMIAQYKSQAEQLNQSFEVSIHSIDNSILSIYQTSELYNFVTKSTAGTGEEIVASQRRTENLLKILAHSLNDYSNVYLYLNERQQLFRVSAKYLNVQVETLSNDQSKSWISPTQRANGELVVVQEDSQSEDRDATVFVGRSISDVILKRQLGVIGIDLGKEYFENIIGSDNVLERVEVLDSDGQLLFSHLHGEQTQGKQLVMESRMNVYGWRVVTYLSQGTLNSIAWEAVRPTIVWGSAFMLMAIALWAALSRQISGPLYSLVRKMRDVGKGNFHKELWSISKPRKDEFGYLEQQFLSMVEKIDEMIKQEYQLKMNASEMQMKALQAQINPHFLYNTLTSIYSEALEVGADQVCKMVKSLSSMFRYTTDFSQDIVPLSAEIAHVRNYLEIQKFRFEDKLDFRFDIPAYLLDKSILKLSLQPIVENAIVHGISRAGKGCIVIEAYESRGMVCIRVEDTAGMLSEEEAAKLTAEIQSEERFGSHIGLVNVQQRILHLFPGSTGISVEVEHGVTSVKITWKAEGHHEGITN
ncbi:sensor histidine kinase [Paenibacillus segetis]|uniref:HAMP domain-containing protein n=1 Tax=Paenibacillus segetis TaxID=1325360 RepID=A0ABQ1Y6Q0_9BACL|nr:histidine kinase [Paenibacillus segetis]GGH13631.1 hypothetical protein GCM10008013_06820 [Paenibacillus segetis]